MSSAVFTQLRCFEEIISVSSKTDELGHRIDTVEPDSQVWGPVLVLSCVISDVFFVVKVLDGVNQ